MKVTEKETGFDYEVFDIIYDKVGYPQFLLYKDGQWIRRSAKFFKPAIKLEDTIVSKTGSHKAMVKRLNNGAAVLLHS